MEAHPLLKDVKLEGFTSSASLYRNQSLRSERAQVIMIGTIAGLPSEPVLWINNTGKNNVIYSSMGAVSDFRNENFRQIMKNSVSYLLDMSDDK
jgi:type 1 glutamine amidotransferase